MANSNSQLLDRLTPAFQGAIWIGDKILDHSIPGYPELNYIFDGLISQTIHLYSVDQKKEKLSFFTKNFGNNFFLYYFATEVKFPLVLPNIPTEDRNKVLIINSTANKKIQIEIFEKNLPGFQFELIEITA